MKIELVQEYRIGGDYFYSIYIDGKYITGTSDKEKAERFYEDAKNNYGNFITKIILKSEEIGVSSQAN